MKAIMAALLMLAATTMAAAAQQCIYAHCGRGLINACDPRCCDLPLSCVRGGPTRPAPPHFRPRPGPPQNPGPHGGSSIK